MSMLGYASENILKNLLVELAKGEREIETARQRLASFVDFTPISAFERIDRRMSNFINSSDILHFLRDHSVHSVTEWEVIRLIKLKAKDQYPILNIKEFT